MMIAIATAASAAAIVIMKMVKNIPSSFPGQRNLLNAMKLMFTLFNISSMLISMVIILRLVNKPYMPMKNKAVLTNNICSNGTEAMLYLLDDFWFLNNGNGSSCCIHFGFFNRGFNYVLSG
jgi:hypothetical protein